MTRTQAEAYAYRLLHENGLNHWKIKWFTDPYSMDAGRTSPTKPLLFFSTPYFACRPEAEQLDTLRHEVAHAIHITENPTTIEDLCADEGGHGPTWQFIAAAAGARPLRFLAHDTAAITDIRIEARHPGPRTRAFLSTPTQLEIF